MQRIGAKNVYGKNKLDCSFIFIGRLASAYMMYIHEKPTGKDHGLSLRSNKTAMYAPNFTFFAVPITYYQELDGCSQTVCLISTSFRRRGPCIWHFFDSAQEPDVPQLWYPSL